MPHFYESVKCKDINYDDEFDKLNKLFSLENHRLSYTYDTLFSYSNDVFRKLQMSINCISIKEFINNFLSEAKDSSEKFIFLVEFLLSLFNQIRRKIGNSPDFNDAITSIVKVIDYDLNLLNLKAKLIIDDKMGELIIVIPKNSILDNVLLHIDDNNVQRYLIEYMSSHNDGKIKRKEELLKLLSNSIEEITKNNLYRCFNQKICENTDFLYNNLDLRHGQKVKDIRFYNATLKNREEWLDITYRNCLLVLNLKDEYENNVKLKEMKRIVYGEKDE